MKTQKIFLVFLFTFWGILLNISLGQTILNGDFENNSASGCSYNLINVAFDTLMQDVYAFSTYEQLDIQTSGCYVTPKSGNWCVGIASAAGSGYDAIAMKLSEPLKENHLYELAFYSYGNTSFSPIAEALEIGVSSDSISFGTTLYNDTVPALTWKFHSFTFTPTTNNLEFITASVVDKDMMSITWVQVDSFALTILCSNVEDTVQITACDSLTWIDGLTYFASTDTPQYTFSGAIMGGCDSTITLNLNIVHDTTGIDSLIACKSFTWIDGNTYTENNNIATYNIVGGAANGCDSMVTLNLTINNVDDSVSRNNATLTAYLAGATYQWLDCENGFAIIDSQNNQSFSPSINGNYAVAVTQNGCTDTSECVAINTVGISDNDWGAKLVYYPNPTTGKFTIDLNRIYQSVQAKIFNLTGQVILSQRFENTNQLNLEIDDVANVYFVELLTAEGQRTIIKVLKE